MAGTWCGEVKWGREEPQCCREVGAFFAEGRIRGILSNTSGLKMKTIHPESNWRERVKTRAGDCTRKLFCKTIDWKNESVTILPVCFLNRQQSAESDVLELTVWQCSSEEAGQSHWNMHHGVRIPWIA